MSWSARERTASMRIRPTCWIAWMRWAGAGKLPSVLDQGGEVSGGR